jgi:hypothetical protein
MVFRDSWFFFVNLATSSLAYLRALEVLSRLTNVQVLLFTCSIASAYLVLRLLTRALETLTTERIAELLIIIYFTLKVISQSLYSRLKILDSKLLSLLVPLVHAEGVGGGPGSVGADLSILQEPLADCLEHQKWCFLGTPCET